jgi:hypothetical protein
LNVTVASLLRDRPTPAVNSRYDSQPTLPIFPVGADSRGVQERRGACGNHDSQSISLPRPTSQRAVRFAVSVAN